MGVRACARLTDCHIETVLNVIEWAGNKCALLMKRHSLSSSDAVLTNLPPVNQPKQKHSK